MKRATWMLAALALLLGGFGQAKADFQMITNGGFETGTFQGWNVGSTETNPFLASFNDGNNAQVVNSTSGAAAWFLRNTATNYFGAPNYTSPISNYTAFNGFDGSGGIFFLRQNISLSGPLQSAALTFNYAVQSNYSGQNRVFDVNILDGSGTIVANVYDYVLQQGYHPAQSTTSVGMDIASTLNSLSPGTYQLEFRETVPQSFSGPATFGIDNISLLASPTAPNPAPEPSSLALVGSGIVCLGGYIWRRRKQPVPA
jgi:hypothetical protein